MRRIALPHLVSIAALVFSASAGAADLFANNVPVSERLKLAREAIAAKDWRRAHDELAKAQKDEPRNADVHNLLGYTYRKQANPNLARAFEHYRTALRLDPGHKGAHEYIGEAYLMDKKPAEAEKHLAQLETLCGNKTCEEYADLAKALADYKAANRQ